MKQRQTRRTLFAIVVFVILAFLVIGGIVRAVTTAHVTPPPSAYLPTSMV